MGKMLNQFTMNNLTEGRGLMLPPPKINGYSEEGAAVLNSWTPINVATASADATREEAWGAKTATIRAIGELTYC